LGVGCRPGEDLTAVPSPTSIVRAGPAYTCGNGLDGCRVTYQVGPVTRVADRLRIFFQVTLDGPAGGTTEWTNDTAMHEHLKQTGGPGIVLTPASDSSVTYELDAVGGIASRDTMLVAPVTHLGYWEFVVPEAPGSVLLLTYPDFHGVPAEIVVP
jgi:hypothetical protein